MIKTIKSKLNSAKIFLLSRSKRMVKRVDRHPLISFFSILGILFVLIVLGSILFKPATKSETTKPPVKAVDVFRIGTAPRLQIQAKVDKSGVVQIVAQTAGVVQQIFVQEGDYVQKGANLAYISSNYQGGNAALLQAELAQKQYQNVLDTYQTQKDIISKQREVANQTQTNADMLRNISAQSIGETQNLLDLNNTILTNYDLQLRDLQSQPSSASNSAAILQIQQLEAQLQAARNGVSSQLRSLEYQTNEASPPAQLANLQKDITLKQLDIQDKMLDLNKEVSRIQLNIAQVSVGLMYPSSPLSGTVQRVFVHEGQAVNPGTPIATMAFDQNATAAIAEVPTALAQSITRIEPSIVHIDNFTFELFPAYISTEATGNQLNSVIFNIPENYQNYLTQGGYISIDVPIGVRDTNASDPFIPLDAVYQTQDKAYVFVIKNGKAQSREVELGSVYGRFVGVDKGISSGDQVILNRNIINNDLVKENQPNSQ